MNSHLINYHKFQIIWHKTWEELNVKIIYFHGIGATNICLNQPFVLEFDQFISVTSWEVLKRKKKKIVFYQKGREGLAKNQLANFFPIFYKQWI